MRGTERQASSVGKVSIGAEMEEEAMRENERMDMCVVEEEGDWEYTVCVENVK